MHKIALGIEYNGSKYCGWQRQNTGCSVQEKLEQALSWIANEPINIFCAGRTDAGVHGVGQVLHFKTTAIRQKKAWTLGVNTYLPKDISVQWAKNVPDDFHARFSAIARQYRYIILNQDLRPAILNQVVTYIHKFLDVESMDRSARCLIGKHDFSSFRSAQCQSKTPWRNLIDISISRHFKYILIDIKANSFVHYMVRNIVGSLIKVGSGYQPESWISSLLAKKNRKFAAETAAPEGLYLMSVDYPECYDLPKSSMKPFFSWY